MSHQGDEEPPVVVRDKRRIDPETGAVRAPATDAATDGAGTGGVGPGGPAGGAAGAGVVGGGAAGGGTAGVGPAGGGTGGAATVAGAGEPTAVLQSQLDERTADLQRVTAEYANYRKRVDRDREAVVTMAKASVVTDLLGVLDDLERADAHGDLTGPFRAVADKITTALQKAGLTPFGHDGEPFDPVLHEAVQHDTSPDVAGPTVTAVLRRGYRFGDRVLRPAMVAVTDHEPAGPVAEDALIEPEPPGALTRSDGTPDPAADPAADRESAH